MRPRDVRRVMDEGRSVRGRRVVVLLAPGTGGCAVVAGRRVGGAVQRNRARRILRAAWHDVAPLARPGIQGAKAQDLVAEMTELLAR